MVSRAFDSGTFDSGLFDRLAIGVLPPKMLLAHVYDSAGNYIKTWADWSSEPRFPWPINSGQGAMSFQLPRAWSQSGERDEDSGDEDIDLGHVVKLFVIDKESGEDGILLYQGRLSEYVFDLAGAILSGTLVPRTSQTVTRWIEGPIDFTDQDPTDIVQYLIDNTYLPGVTADPTNVAVGTTWSPTVARERVKNVLDRAQQLAGGFWYWRLNADYTLSFKASPVFEPDHIFTVGVHIAADAKFSKSDIDKRRSVRVYGAKEKFEEDDAGNQVRVQEEIFAEVADVGYDPTVEPLDHVYANSRITDYGTAYRIANALLEFLNTYFLETEVLIADSNFDPYHGYDIESLKPGQVVQIRHPVRQHQFRLIGDHIIGDGHVIGGDWVSVVLRPVIIANVDYRWTHAILKLQLRPNRLAEELVAVSDRVLLEETR